MGKKNKKRASWNKREIYEIGDYERDSAFLSDLLDMGIVSKSDDWGYSFNAQSASGEDLVRVARKVSDYVGREFRGSNRGLAASYLELNINAIRNRMADYQTLFTSLL